MSAGLDGTSIYTQETIFVPSVYLKCDGSNQRTAIGLHLGGMGQCHLNLHLNNYNHIEKR